MLRTFLLLQLWLLSSLPALAAPFAYIPNSNSNNVSVIDTASNTVVATVGVGTNPYAVAVNSAGTRAYVTNLNSSNVSVIDTASNAVIATVAVAGSPFGVAVNPAGTRAYVANYGSNDAWVIDTASNTVIATVGVGAAPYGVAVNPAGTRVYVANYGSNDVSVIDTASNTVIATVAVGTFPLGVALNPAGTRAYVANFGSDNVSVIDTASNTVIATVAVGIDPRGVAVNPAGTRAYVTNSGSGTVSVIDTANNSITATVAVAGSPVGVALTPAGTWLYVANRTSNIVSVIDTANNTVITTVGVGAAPFAVGQFIMAPTPAAVSSASSVPCLSLAGLAPTVTVLPCILDMSAGEGPNLGSGMLSTLSGALGVNLSYVNQSGSGAVMLDFNGGRLSFIPLFTQSSDPRSTGLHAIFNGNYDIVTNGTEVTVAPGVINLNELASLIAPGALQVNPNGTLTAVISGLTHVLHPAYLVQMVSPGAPSLTTGADGQLRFTDSSGNSQILHPAFLEPDSLYNALLGLDGDAILVIQLDGTAAIRFHGQSYVLVPEYTLGGVAGHAVDTWWPDGQPHYRLRNLKHYIGTSQRFWAR